MVSAGRILLIDDDDRWRKVVSLMLATAGYDVQEASDGLVGLTAYHQQRCDLVITDILMPNKEGLETIREFKQVDAQVKVIAMSTGGAERAGYLDMALRFGARRILHKPFTRDELLAAVIDVLATS